MARTFGFDVMACPRCGGRPRLIALIEEAAGSSCISACRPDSRAASSPPPLHVGVREADAWTTILGVQPLFLTFLSDGPAVGGAGSVSHGAKPRANEIASR
jgi:hypothetical protein